MNQVSFYTVNAGSTHSCGVCGGLLISPPTLISTTESNRFTPLPRGEGLSKGFLENVGKRKSNRPSKGKPTTGPHPVRGSQRDIAPASVERVDVRDLVLTCCGEWTLSIVRQTAGFAVD